MDCRWIAPAGNSGETLDLWVQQKLRVERYGNEASLEQAFIQPVFQILGWKLKYQTFLQGKKPDYALFIRWGAGCRARGRSQRVRVLATRYIGCRCQSLACQS